MQNKYFEGQLGSYAHLKFMVSCGFDLAEIRENMPWNTPVYVIEESILRAKHELYVESNIIPSEAGKLLYDANS